jgi:diaminohydroxyphosphoribosylaminopyrimidine deaminase / 5-amino-6-(5-phosphoribosylamino)uracil reductase
VVADARDAVFMERALLRAERGRGQTTPNPMVGAVVVSPSGVVVGQGAHLRAGGPHAEVVALDSAGALARGATLYCTLEPCSHTGRTGPCAPLVTEAGIARAIIAIEDPNPLVNGAGLRHLRDCGVAVTVGVERERAAEQNAVFLTNVRARRPYVILKAALSADGKLSAAPGVRTRLTGPAANRRIHRQRAEVDAIAVGSGTILADDPLLTARCAYRNRSLTRVIFDRRLRTPPTARVLSTLNAGPVIIISTKVACADKGAEAAALTASGARVLAAPGSDLTGVLTALYEDGITSIVLEGGAGLHRAALDEGLVDAVNLYIAPTLLGSGAVEWIGGGRLSWDALLNRHATWLDDVVLVEGYVHRIG